jgi:hypothetical protein
MDKIWITKRKGTNKRNFIVYKSESDLIKNIRSSDDIEIFEYVLESKLTTKDYLLQRERDLQLRNLLNELSTDEILINEFVKMYDKIAPDGGIIKHYYHNGNITRKQFFIENFKKCNTKKDIAKILINDKKYFIKLSTDIDWYYSILKIHNFRDYNFKNEYYSSNEKKWIIEEIPEEIKINFKLAKEKLKKK